MKKAYLFDSTIAITPEAMKKYHIGIQPLYVVIDDIPYKDQVDLSSEAFYQKLREGLLPTTSQPSVGDFVKTYETLKEQGYTDVFVFTIAHALSGTANTANIAGDMVDALNIHVFDTGNTSYLLGLCALDVIKFAETTDDITAIFAFANDLFSRVDIRFYVDSLDALKRGGRINSFQAAMGNLLQIKPLLRLQQGIVENYGKARTSKKAAQMIITDMQSAYPFEKVVLLHSFDQKIIDTLTEAIETTYPGISYELAPLSSVIGVHTGAHVGAIAVVSKK